MADISEEAVAELIAFLKGAGPLEGVWFGDKHPTQKGAFWWRSRIEVFTALRARVTELDAALAASEQRAAEARAEEREACAKVAWDTDAKAFRARYTMNHDRKRYAPHQLEAYVYKMLNIQAEDAAAAIRARAGE